MVGLCRFHKSFITVCLVCCNCYCKQSQLVWCPNVSARTMRKTYPKINHGRHNKTHGKTKFFCSKAKWLISLNYLVALCIHQGYQGEAKPRRLSKSSQHNNEWPSLPSSTIVQCRSATTTNSCPKRKFFVTWLRWWYVPQRGGLHSKTDNEVLK